MKQQTNKQNKMWMKSWYQIKKNKTYIFHAVNIHIKQATKTTFCSISKKILVGFGFIEMFMQIIHL